MKDMYEEVILLVKKEIDNLPGWSLSNNKIAKTFLFDSHINAIKFAEAVSLEAISEEIYPEIKITFEKVELTFLAEKDSDIFKGIDLIKKIEKFCDCYNLK